MPVKFTIPRDSELLEFVGTQVDEYGFDTPRALQLRQDVKNWLRCNSVYWVSMHLEFVNKENLWDQSYRDPTGLVITFDKPNDAMMFKLAWL